MAAGAPYPGPMPFKTEEANLFFGREREARDLMALLSTNPVILLYAQSGSGKSSLINARLIPMLHKKNLAVLPVARVSGALPDQISQEQISNIFVFNAVLSCAGIGSNAQSLLTASLGDVFNSPEMAGTNLDGAVRILIFDQFEEISPGMSSGGRTVGGCLSSWRRWWKKILRRAYCSPSGKIIWRSLTHFPISFQDVFALATGSSRCVRSRPCSRLLGRLQAHRGAMVLALPRIS